MAATSFMLFLVGTCRFIAYIDPNTTRHIFTIMGPLLAVFAAGAGLATSVFFFARRQFANQLEKLSRPARWVLLIVFVIGCAVVIWLVYTAVF